MEKHIMGENGISYTLGADGLYYPDLYLPEETEYPIGKYGMYIMRREHHHNTKKWLHQVDQIVRNGENIEKALFLHVRIVEEKRI